jgi:2Fe-2S ferredoxin
MPKIIFIEPDESRREVQGEAGRTVMDAACANLVKGILADCGGSCSCATCHVYVDDAWAARLPAPSADELLLLDGAVDLLPTSRLSCQIRISEALDGLVVRCPKSQI